MPSQNTVDTASFRRILARNVSLPLISGVVSAVVFASLIAYLLSAMHWVDHSERVLGDANQIVKLTVDQEAGMRGFLLTGDKTFLAPYRIGKASINSQMASLMELVSDNPPQVERLKRIRGLQNQWGDFAGQMIELRNEGKDALARQRVGEGKIEFVRLRAELTHSV